MVLIAVTCPYCQSDQITKRGKTDTDKQRYHCHNPHQTASKQILVANLGSVPQLP
jgi:transposase-like protein